MTGTFRGVQPVAASAVFALIGAFVGLFVGRPIWSLIRDKNSTSWIAILKSAFGFGIGCGLYALVNRVVNPELAIASVANVFDWSPTLGGAIGAVYGGFVELDDAIGDDKGGQKPRAGQAARSSDPAIKTKQK